MSRLIPVTSPHELVYSTSAAFSILALEGMSSGWANTTPPLKEPGA